jgi:hypothetical protein
VVTKRRISKTKFVEVRTFLHLFRSFDRMWAFFILAFQVHDGLCSCIKYCCLLFRGIKYCYIVLCMPCKVFPFIRFPTGNGHYCLEPFWLTFFYISSRGFQKCIDNLHNGCFPELPSRYNFTLPSGSLYTLTSSSADILSTSCLVLDEKILISFMMLQSLFQFRKLLTFVF